MASFFGPISCEVNSTPTATQVILDAPDRKPPQEIIVHLRRPDNVPLRAVRVNDQSQTEFNPSDERISLTGVAGRLVIDVDYA
jgi:hypothetical protein